MKMMMKTFKFEVSVESIPYSVDTVKELFGKGASYNSDYPENVLAQETILELMQDAIVSVLDSKISLMARSKIGLDITKLTDSDKGLWDYLENKEAMYRKIKASVKPLTVPKENK